MKLFELFKTVDISKIGLDFYQGGSLDDSYEDVNKNNYLDLLKEANNEIKFLFSHNNLSGFFIVDWRVNFSYLKEYIIENIPHHLWSEDIKSFMNYYDERSTDELYKRLGIA